MHTGSISRTLSDLSEINRLLNVEAAESSSCTWKQIQVISDQLFWDLIFTVMCVSMVTLNNRSPAVPPLAAAAADFQGTGEFLRMLLECSPASVFPTCLHECLQYLHLTCEQTGNFLSDNGAEGCRQSSTHPTAHLLFL